MSILRSAVSLSTQVKRHRDGLPDPRLGTVHATLVLQLRALVVEEPAVVVARAPGTARIDSLVDMLAYTRRPAEVKRRVVDVYELAGGDLNAVQSYDPVRVELEDM